MAIKEPKPEEKKIQAELVFGLPGHEWQYIFKLFPATEIPSQIGEIIESELGDDWDIMDRGNRIEITNKKEFGSRDDDKVMAAVRKAISDKYEFKDVL